MSAPQDEHLRASYYCAAALLRSRQRSGEPIPEWLRRHYYRLDAAIRMSRPGHESGSNGQQLAKDGLITTRRAAVILRCSARHVQRIASDLDGQFVDGRWLFSRSAVEAYAEEKFNA